MKLSKREKIGLGILGILLIGFIYYRWIFIPQTNTLELLKIEQKNQEDEKKRVQSILDMQPIFQEKSQVLTKKWQNFSVPFFTNIHQQDVILLLQELDNPFPFEIVEMSFSEINPITWIDKDQEEKIGQDLTVSLQYEGTYDGIMHFLKKLEDYPKKIIVDQIRLQQVSNSSQLGGNIVLHFYGFPEIEKEDLLFHWEQNTILTQQNLAIPWIQNIPVETEMNEEQSDTWEEFIENNGQSIDEKSIVQKLKSKTIFQFHPQLVFCVGEPKEVQGTIRLFEEDLLLEYHFLKDIGQRRVNIVVEESSAIISSQPLQVIIPIYAFANEKHGVGMVIRDALGKEKEILLADQINWLGWKTLQTELPVDITYPIVIQRIYIEAPSQSSYGATGKLLFDRIDIVE
ncbi:MAG: hypothetical protein GX347_05995 [Epulopiscium sp.]|nr:hypothetical protein [Candidatus Epulonipiscium sp.]